MSKPSRGVDQSFRRTWDKEVFLKKAEERAQREEFGEDLDHNKNTVQTGELKSAKARDEGIDLTSRVGKFQVVSDAAPNAQQPGFYCEPCDCLLKDSVSYLDHINGKKHQRAMGTSLAPERATVNQVRDRLKLHKVKAAEAKNDLDFETRMEKLKESDKKENEPNKKKKKKKQKEEPVEKIPIEDASELAGFGLPMGFGTSKR